MNPRLEKETQPAALEICANQIEKVMRTGQVLTIQLKGSEKPIGVEFPDISSAIKAEQQLVVQLPEVVS